MKSNLNLDTQIILVKPDQNLFAIRQKVLRPHQTIEQVQYKEDFFETSFHLAITPKTKPELLLCVASFSEQFHLAFHDTKQYRLRGMATIEECRGQGMGAHLLEYSFEILKQKNVQLLWCNAREKAFSFYEKLGLQYEGPIFNIDDIGPHKVMYKKFD